MAILMLVNSLYSDTLGRDGGSVVDAAIATLLCLGVVQLQATGIGGGFIMTYYDA